MALEKSIKDSIDSWLQNLDPIRQKVKTIEWDAIELEVLTTRVNEVEEQVSDIEDKLMERKELRKKREKQLKDH